MTEINQTNKIENLSKIELEKINYFSIEENQIDAMKKKYSLYSKVYFYISESINE